MHVHELATGVSDAKTKSRHGDRRDHDPGSQRTRQLTTPENEHQGREQERDATGPRKLLGCLLVGFNGTFLDDPFDPFFVVAARIDGDEARPEQRGLEDDDGNPGHGAGPPGPEGPCEAGGYERHEHRHPQRKVDDGGMQWQ